MVISSIFARMIAFDPRKSLRLSLLMGVALGLSGCAEHVYYVGHPYRHHEVYYVERREPVVVVETPPPGYVETTPVYVDPAPAYVEEGTVVDGVVVAEPAYVDYVYVSGGWYYWHPGCRCWVHAYRPYGWHPGGGVHVYASWGSHPMYHRR